MGRVASSKDRNNYMFSFKHRSEFAVFGIVKTLVCCLVSRAVSWAAPRFL